MRRGTVAVADEAWWRMKLLLADADADAASSSLAVSEWLQRLANFLLGPSPHMIGIDAQIHNFFPVRISTSNPSAYSIQLPPSNSTLANATDSNESMLVLLRHGESMWNEKNLFTGCVDVPLTIKGLAEAIGAGKRISKVPIDLIYTSSLIRAQMTAVIAMTQHGSKKVPIIVHNESEQAKIWSEIHSETAIKESISVITAWQLNERMYGDLQGLNKQEIAEKLGHVIVHAWRRTCFTRPPNGESLEMCGERAVSYFTENIEPQLQIGKNLLITAHANSLRSIIMYLENLTPEEIINLQVATGVPMLYTYKDGNFKRRGSLMKSSEIGVYALTEKLADYRQQLDHK